MTNVNWKSSRGSSRGLTLLEVLAGLALLSTLLVAVLVTGTRHMRQWKLARTRLAAAALAEEVLTAWATSGSPRLATNGSDKRGPGDLVWRVRRVERTSMPETLEAEIVRLEVSTTGATEQEPPLVAIELLQPDREREEDRNKEEQP